MKFNVNRVDNMVIQAIFLLDTLDKDINSFSMRVRSVGKYLCLRITVMLQLVMSADVNDVNVVTNLVFQSLYTCER